MTLFSWFLLSKSSTENDRRQEYVSQMVTDHAFFTWNLKHSSLHDFTSHKLTKDAIFLQDKQGACELIKPHNECNVSEIREFYRATLCVTMHFGNGMRSQTPDHVHGLWPFAFSPVQYKKVWCNTQ